MCGVARGAFQLLSASVEAGHCTFVEGSDKGASILPGAQNGGCRSGYEVLCWDRIELQYREPLAEGEGYHDTLADSHDGDVTLVGRYAGGGECALQRVEPHRPEHGVLCGPGPQLVHAHVNRWCVNKHDFQVLAVVGGRKRANGRDCNSGKRQRKCSLTGVLMRLLHFILFMLICQCIVPLLTSM